MPIRATRESLQSKSTRRFKDIEIDGELYRIQSLTALEWIQFTQHENRNEPTIILYCLVDENDERLLTDDDQDLVEGLDSAISHKLIDECWSHAALTKEAVDDAAKNSEETGSNTSE